MMMCGIFLVLPCDAQRSPVNLGLWAREKNVKDEQPGGGK